MSAFRKGTTSLSGRSSNGSSRINDIILPSTKTVASDDSSEPTIFVEMVKKDVRDYAESLGIPKDENYQLRDMIRSGNIPDEVNVRGMLDSSDPLDLSNVGEGDRIYDHLTDIVDSQPKQDVTPDNGNVE